MPIVGKLSEFRVRYNFIVCDSSSIGMELLLTSAEIVYQSYGLSFKY